jgi:ADP-ribose pyrophosphatase YjhB (NUDIX family)
MKKYKVSTSKHDTKNYFKNLKVSTSYGILCCKKNKNTKANEILFIKKKNTYSYISFIRGIYSEDYGLFKLFNTMTLDEKLTILSLNFNLIWFKYYLTEFPENDKKAIRYKKKFDKVKEMDNGLFLYNIIKKTTSTDLIYEIPKGHSNKNENKLNAAIREFYEETNISKEKYKILYDRKPLYYSFEDENVKYNYYYYIAIMLDNNYEPKINYDNQHMLYEISDIKFLPYDHIHLINNRTSFLSMIKTAIKIIKQYY